MAVWMACPKHPDYKGIHMPTSQKPGCWCFDIWLLKQDLDRARSN